MIRIIAFLLVFPSMVFAQAMPQPLSDGISDFADLLTPDQEISLTKSLQDGRDATGVHVTVVTMGRIADYGGQGQSIETYAKNLFNLWGVGDAKRNDGILILVAKDDRAVRIALGDGFDAVYDGTAQRVIDSVMLPAFRDGNYGLGIILGAQLTYAQLAKPYAEHNPPPAVKSKWDSPDIFGAVVVGFAVLMIALGRIAGKLVAHFRRCPSCGQRGMSQNDVVETAATRVTAGSGTRTVRCNHCSYSNSYRYHISRLSSRSSGGGSSGFGGGRSSGGGATGRW